KSNSTRIIGFDSTSHFYTHHRSGKQVHSTDDAPPDGDGAVDPVLPPLLRMSTRVRYARQPARSPPYSSRLPTAAVRSARSAPRLALPPPYTLPAKDSALGGYGGKKVAAVQTFEDAADYMAYLVECDIQTRWGTNTSWGCMVRRKRADKASQVRIAGRASELTQRPPTITESIDQLGDLVAAHRSGALTTASPTLLSSGLPFFSLTGAQPALGGRGGGGGVSLPLAQQALS
ncbi:hypothetical protein ALC62_08539, partial [Cyphomyrmex costatus]